MTIFLEYSYLFDSIFPGINLIDKLHDIEERICFHNNGCHGKRRNNFSLFIATTGMSKNVSSKA